jgi:hypothetical protein
MTPAAPHPPLPGPRLRTALPLLALGVVLAVTGLVVLVRNVLDYLDSSVHAVPGTVTLHLESGPWLVFTQNQSGVDATTIRVTGPDGDRVPVHATSSNQNIGQGGAQYWSVAGFDAARDGRYRIRVESTGGPSQVIVARPFERMARENVAWILLFLAGGLLGLVAFVLLLVGIVRRSRARRDAAMAGGTGGYAVAAPGAPPVHPGLPPADWYPDPSGEHRLRYWDGTGWTGHTSD